MKRQIAKDFFRRRLSVIGLARKYERAFDIAGHFQYCNEEKDRVELRGSPTMLALEISKALRDAALAAGNEALEKLEPLMEKWREGAKDIRRVAEIQQDKNTERHFNQRAQWLEECADELAAAIRKLKEEA